MDIGFIGLGGMGGGMAKNLLKGGHRLTVCNRSGKGFAEFEALGAKTTTRPADAASGDAVFLCLPNSDANAAVCDGPDGVLAALRPGQAVVDFGTSRYGDTLAMAEDCASRGAGFLDAPISGLPIRAASGELTIMCGGDKALFDRLLPVLECMGSTVVHMGPTGSGQLTKLVNQLLYNISCAALAEVLPMAVKMGLDPAQVTKVVNSGTGRSHASEYFLPLILKGDFDGGFPLEQAYKDMQSAALLSAGQQIPMPVLAAATATYQTALLKGFGGSGKGAMIRVYEELLGVEFRERQ